MATFFKVLAIIEWIAGGILFFVYLFGGFTGFLIGLSILAGAFISGMFCMAISVILKQQDEILSAISRVNTELDKQNNDNIAPIGLGYTQRKSLSERLSSDSPNAAKVWSCKKCGEVNPLSSSICKSCGSYK